VDPRAGLDECGKSRPHRDSIPGPEYCVGGIEKNEMGGACGAYG